MKTNNEKVKDVEQALLEAVRLYLLDCKVEKLPYNDDTYEAAQKAYKLATGKKFD